MRRLLIVFTSIAFLAISGCGDSGPTGPASFDVTGQWSGAIETGGLVEVQLNEDSDGDISGGGTISVGDQSLSVNVSGTHVDASVTLQVSSSGLQDLTYNATLEGEDRMNGTLHGSGYSGESLTLNRD